MVRLVQGDDVARGRGAAREDLEMPNPDHRNRRTRKTALLLFPWVAERSIRGCTPPPSYVSGCRSGHVEGERGAGSNDMASGARLG